MVPVSITMKAVISTRSSLHVDLSSPRFLQSGSSLVLEHPDQGVSYPEALRWEQVRVVRTLSNRICQHREQALAVGSAGLAALHGETPGW